MLFEDTGFGTTAAYMEEQNSELGWLVVRDDWIFSQCLGCDSLNLEIISFHSGKDSIDHEVSRKLIPGKAQRIPEPWIFRLSSIYIEILVEIYDAFNRKSYRLASMGLRTLLDIFIVENIGDEGTYKKKLKKLKDEGMVNNHQLEQLNTLVEAGNASAHRGFKPSKNGTSVLIDIIEHLLKPTTLRTDLNKLENEIPSRKKSNKFKNGSAASGTDVA